jgi:hypothetical protein
MAFTVPLTDDVYWISREESLNRNNLNENYLQVLAKIKLYMFR